MLNPQSVTFHEALEIVESLPEYQQETTIDIIPRRFIDAGRDAIAQNIEEARKECARGNVRKGSVNDLMQEIAWIKELNSALDRFASKFPMWK